MGNRFDDWAASKAEAETPDETELRRRFEAAIGSEVVAAISPTRGPELTAI